MRSSSLSVGAGVLRLLVPALVLVAIAGYGYLLKLAYDCGFLLFWIYYVTIYM